MDKVEFRAQEYIDDVLSGRQVVCKWARLAVERHVRDLQTGPERGLEFDQNEGEDGNCIFFTAKTLKR